MAGNFKKLVRTRQRYTNEPLWRLREVIRSTSCGDSLIPAAEPRQAEFEAELLGSVGYGISPQETDSVVKHPFGIVSVAPGEQVLEIVLADSCAAAFISKIAPFVDEGRSNVSGVVGLRVSFDGRGAVLRRLHCPGSIVLRGIGEQAWYACLAEDFDDLDAAVQCYIGSSPALHALERGYLDEFPFVDRCASDRTGVEIISGILRRAGAFRAPSRMFFTDLWFNLLGDEAIINVEWSGDLSHFDLISRLLDGRFGLPLEVVDKEQCYCDPCTRHTYAVDLRDRPGGNVLLSLRRSELNGKKLPPRRSGPCSFAGKV